MKSKFLEGITKVYQLSLARDKEINTYLSCIKDKNSEKRQTLELFLKVNGFEVNSESLSAISERFARLKEGPLIQLMEGLGMKQEEQDLIRKAAYISVSECHLKYHGAMLKEIESKKLLPKFYMEFIKGWHEVGILFSAFHLAWNQKIIIQNNRTLTSDGRTEESAIKSLRQSNLLDRGHRGEEADRSYSALTLTAQGYESRAYVDAFRSEIIPIIRGLQRLYAKLETLEDDTLNQKQAVLDYIKSLINAFHENDTDKLVQRWYEVDMKWMNFKGPIQPSHPLEYYEDGLRKAVACEWDIRIEDISLTENKRAESLERLFLKLSKELNLDTESDTFKNSLVSLKKVQIYRGTPMVYYGSNFNGTFSAQVVPNDSIVTAVAGKKVFAYTDRILEFSRSGTIKELATRVWGRESVMKGLVYLMNDTKTFHKIYDRETIGHEFGHPLFIGKDTEARMDNSGVFKLIEEWKATMGGVLAFFEEGEKELEERFLIDFIGRCVATIAWMKERDYRPYYTEVLISLKGIFDSGLILFSKNKVKIDLSPEKITVFKVWAKRSYCDLAKTYIAKEDASNFLNKFAKLEGEVYLPIDPMIKEFVLWYYDMFQQYGNVTDTAIIKSDYIIK